MPTFTKGAFSIDLAFEPIPGELGDDDRQAAWQLYLSIATRLELRQPSVTAATCVSALEEFLREARLILSRYPVGKTRTTNHLGFFLALMLELIVCPFLSKWRGVRPDDGIAADWAELRSFLDALMAELARKYAFVDLLDAMPLGLKDAWGLPVE